MVVRKPDRTDISREIPSMIRADVPRRMISAIDLSKSLAEDIFKKSYEKMNDYQDEMQNRELGLNDIRTVSKGTLHRGINRIKNQMIRREG